MILYLHLALAASICNIHAGGSLERKRSVSLALAPSDKSMSRRRRWRVPQSSSDCLINKWLIRAAKNQRDARADGVSADSERKARAQKITALSHRANANYSLLAAKWRGRNLRLFTRLRWSDWPRSFRTERG